MEYEYIRLCDNAINNIHDDAMIHAIIINIQLGPY